MNAEYNGKTLVPYSSGIRFSLRNKKRAAVVTREYMRRILQRNWAQFLKRKVVFV